jgi:hypothetical protein
MAVGGHPRRPENKIQKKKVTKKSTDFCFGTRHRFFFFPAGPHRTGERRYVPENGRALSLSFTRNSYTHGRRDGQGGGADTVSRY